MICFNLIRHGKTQWNLEQRIQGRTDVPLSAQGRRQVASWCPALGDLSLDLIVSSPMARARQTAEIIGQGLGLSVVMDENLKEQSFGLWEGKTINQIRQTSPGTVEHQEGLGWDFCPPEGETRHGVLKRALGALGAAAQRYNGLNLLIVTHNGVIKSLAYHALGRGFLPGEERVIKDGHLHRFAWDQTMVLERLNLINLNQEAQ
ncbi:GpmB [Desulforapulum autotrophicum HRM2]|uniref:GpmB n=1 Tax=Desulforapulum autotrophicum (strain ATCC 43914 / DSM 3382 / VKM B-1955 / HRM2) TaxID=177437 RepID=C0QCZ4_DESAH|nr:histidine phosphatase family protein [Desulforapulum autotrophicum]ACN17226.1 GpmB [Desulforapulum autotrophicum HRM2]